MKYTSKKYADYSVKNAVALILTEVVKNKISGGWGGNQEQLDTFKLELKKYNVEYIDDMSGEWALAV
jgi:hypothetical protein